MVFFKILLGIIVTRYYHGCFYIHVVSEPGSYRKLDQLRYLGVIGNVKVDIDIIKRK